MSDGAEGPRPPPAPEAPEPETPPPAEPADEASTEARRPRLLPVWILLGAALVSGVAWAATEYMGGGPPPDEAQVQLITASAEPWKVRPDDPGGMEIPNRDALIYETLTTADPEEGPERILPPPEEPLSPPRPAADAEHAAAAPEPAPAQEPVPEPPVEAPLESEATEPVPVAEALPAEPETPSFAPAVPPRPPKPGTLAAVQIDEIPLTGLESPAPVEEVPLTELDVTLPIEEAMATGPEAPALLEEVPSQEPEMPSAQSDPAMASRVPLPIDKPVGLARLTRVGQPAGETATAVSEPSQSNSQSWRYVQLGAANGRGPLEGHWEMLRRRHDDVLVGLSPLIMPVDSGDNGITYRLRAGPLSDRSAAQRVCAQLKVRGLDCFVPRD